MLSAPLITRRGLSQAQDAELDRTLATQKEEKLKECVCRVKETEKLTPWKYNKSMKEDVRETSYEERSFRKRRYGDEKMK